MSCMIVAGILGGGYFVSVSAALGIFMLGVLFYRMYIQKKVTAAWDVNMLAFAVLVFGYLTSCLWAVDSGMALLGVVKFLPLPLFYVLVSGQRAEVEKMIDQLPLLGCLMTIFSFLMMQFSIYEEWVSVAGRLAGFFQYPNTYALFMLICLLVLMWRYKGKQTDWLDYGYGLAAVFGIVMSGSRTVLILTAFAVIWSLIARQAVRKRIVIYLIIGGMIAALTAVLLGSAGVLERFGDISFGASTFLGRLLYVRDALPLILRYPFGMGYYGYYFIQQSVQTGVYSVVNVHNELMQTVLDVGVIPAGLLCYAVIRSWISKHTCQRDRIVLSVMMLHCLLDYDFQFMVMGFVLILFLDKRNIRTYRTPILTGSVVGMAGAGMIVLSAVSGMSDICYLSGNYVRALDMYDGNTMARISLLSQAGESEDMSGIAETIIEKNRYVAVAYSAKARALFSAGDIEGFIDNKQKAIELAPYQYEEYLDYLEVLSYCVNVYLAEGNTADARICAQRAEEIPKMLEEVEEKTSWLGWRIDDRPQVTLSYEAQEMIREMGEVTDD